MKDSVWNVGFHIACGLAIAAGGCADAYRQSADADVYRLLRDHKAEALGYQPQTVSDPVVRTPGSAAASQPSGAAGAAENRGGLDAESARNNAEANDPATATPKRAFARIPLTPIPPSEPPALEPPSTVKPLLPLGPNPGEVPPDETEYDPFAGEMAARWAENRLMYGPPAPRKSPLKLDLFGALRYAVQHGRDYRTQMDSLYLAALDVTLQRHLLSPRPFVNTGLLYNGGQKDSAYASALTATLDAGVRQKLPYGGEIVAETLVNFVNAIGGNATDGESASVALSGSIPLLRGAGMINLEPLISSERTLVYQVRGFEEYRRQFAIDVANAYFQLQASIQAVNNRRTNVANSVSLLDRTRAIYGANLGAAGGGGRLRLSYLEVQRAEQQLLDAQNSLIDSQQSYLNALDNFKIQIGMDIRDDLDIVPVALDLNMPDLEKRDVVELAGKLRLDLQTARDRMDDARRGVSNAANGLLPDLNLTADTMLGNRVDTPAKSIDSRNLTYTAGITLGLPIDRLAERNTYRAALISFYAAQRGYEELNDRVAADVRAAVRAIRASVVSVAIQKHSIRLADQRLENANLLLKRGDTNARDVVEAQTALISAQDSYEQAQADLQVQVLQFLKQTGTLRIDPDSGTLGQALDRSGGPWESSLLHPGANGLAGPG